MPDYIYPVKFHFRVDFLDLGNGTQGVEEDSYFQSVAGLNVDMQTESFKEGGENRFEHVVPTRAKYDTLVLKRGVLRGSEVTQWFIDALVNHTFQPVNLAVLLLNENHESIVTWNVKHAWPKKWSVDDLDAQKSEILVETLEMQYAFFTVNQE